MTMYANQAGETISFMFDDGSATTSLTETVTFEINANTGKVTEPMLLSAASIGSAASC